MGAPQGITNLSQMAPELPLQYSEDLLSTPQTYLVHSIGAERHYAEAHMGRNKRLSRYERLSTDGGELDGSGIDPAPEVPLRSDVDAKVELYAKVITINEQVELFENSKILTKFTALLGQWLREKEDLLMRDLYASSVSYLNATGGLNNDIPSDPTRESFNNIERILLNNRAFTLLRGIPAEDKIGTAPQRDSFICLAHTDITPDIQNISGFKPVAEYPSQMGLREEEYGSVNRFRIFVTQVGAKLPNASRNGNTVFLLPMYGVEAASKIEQNGYTAKVGFRPAWVVSRVAQNSELYAKFAIARCINNQNWISGLKVTQRL